MNFNELEGQPLYEAYSKKVEEMAKHFDHPNTQDVHIELKGFAESLMTVANMHTSEMASEDDISDTLKFMAGDVNDVVDLLDEVFSERPDELKSEYIQILEELRMMRLKSYI